MDDALTRTLPYGDRPITISGAPGDPYAQSITLDEPSALHYAALLLRAESHVIDIGANIGVTACVFARHTAAPVYALEPSPVAFKHLCRTKDLSGANVVRPRQFAVGRTAGTAAFFDNPTTASASHLVTADTIGRDASAEVPMTTLDAFTAEEALPRLDLIKIDVEGFEREVLAGATDTLSRFAPRVLMEFNAFTLIGFANQNPRTVLSEFRTLFPHLYAFDGMSPYAIATDADVLALLNRTLLGEGCMTELMGTFEPLP
ncbi:MAG: FkbM family methyltransferase [Pseudomonadota bacterium]